VDIAVKYIYRGYTAALKHLPTLALLVVAASLGVGPAIVGGGVGHMWA
jgi:hypothetical protein